VISSIKFDGDNLRDKLYKQLLAMKARLAGMPTCSNICVPFPSGRSAQDTARSYGFNSGCPSRRYGLELHFLVTGALHVPANTVLYFENGSFFLPDDMHVREDV
jgi:hypothetical protein